MCRIASMAWALELSTRVISIAGYTRLEFCLKLPSFLSSGSGRPPVAALTPGFGAVASELTVVTEPHEACSGCCGERKLDESSVDDDEPSRGFALFLVHI